jgi:DNA-binding transcriptional ArsR family regulator
MAHHNSSTPKDLSIFYKKGIEKEKRYGVPQTRRILTMGMFHKYHDEILRQLTWLGLETRERDAIFKLLELYIYYGKVYPKAADIADQAYISKRTFWRAIRKLLEIGVIEVLNRYAKHRQISNLYRLDKLVLMLARFLAEHGHKIGNFGIKLVSLLAHFWQEIWSVEINLSLTAPVKPRMVRG